MQQVQYTPISLKEMLSNSGLETGQKNYVQAWQRAAQFSNILSVATSIKAKSIAQTVPKDFPATTIIHNGVHHAKK